MKVIRILSALVGLMLSFGQMQAQDHFVEISTMRQMFQDFKHGASLYYGERFSETSMEYVKVMSTSDVYIDYMVGLDYGNVPEWEKPIIDHIKTGQFAGAIARYERRNLVNDLANDASFYPSVVRYLMVLELSGNRQNAVKAMTLVQNAVDNSNVSLESKSGLVNLAIDMRQYPVAEQFISTLEYIARSDRNVQAEAYAMRTKLSLRRGKPNEGMTAGRAAIALYDSLANERGDSRYEAINRARLYLDLGRLQYRFDELELSLKSLYQSFAFFENDASDNFAKHMCERLRAYYSMGMLATDLKDYSLANELYQKIDAHGAWMFEGSPFQQATFSFDKNRLKGLALVRNGQTEEALSAYEQASMALDEMERFYPGGNLDAFQNLNFNIASLYYGSGNLEKALEYDLKVLNMLLANKQQDEHRHKNDLAFCYKYVGNCYWAIGYQRYVANKHKKSKEIMKFFQDAQKSYQMALRYKANDSESLAKNQLAQLILQGYEKPQPFPKNF